MAATFLLRAAGLILLLLSSELRSEAQAVAAGNPCPNAQPAPTELKAPKPLPPGENFSFEKELLSYFSSYNPKGRANADKVYLSGQGRSVVKYVVQLPAEVDPKNIRVQATLYYQSLPPYFLNDRFKTAGSNSQRLEYLAGHLNLSDTPMANWKLEIAAASAPGNGSSGVVR